MKKNNKIISKIRELIFLLGYLIYLASFYIIYASNYQSLVGSVGLTYKSVYYLAMFFVLVSVPLQQNKFSEWVLSGVVLLLGFISLIMSGDNLFAIVCIFLVASRGIDFRNFFKVDIYIRSLLFLFIAISSYFGVIHDVVMYRVDGVSRTSFGFLQPNTAGALILSIMLEYIVIRFKKIHLFDYVILGSVALFVFYTTNSRSSFIGIIVAMALTAFLKAKERRNSFSKFTVMVLTIMPVVFAVLSYIAVAFYNSQSNIWYLLDRLFSGRIHLINYFINAYPLKLFGQHVLLADPMNLKNTYFLVMDNSYISILLKYGILAITFFLFLYSYKVKKSFDSANELPLVIPVIVMCAVGLMETELYYPAYNISLMYLMHRSNIVKDEKKYEL